MVFYFIFVCFSGPLPNKIELYSDCVAQFPYLDVELPPNIPIAVHQGVVNAYKETNRQHFLNILKRQVNEVLEGRLNDGRRYDVPSALRYVVTRLPHPWNEDSECIVSDLKEIFTK